MLLVEVVEMPNGTRWDGTAKVNVYGFNDLAEFAQFKREKNHPLIKAWYGNKYDEEYLSLTYVCRECTEENRAMAKEILEDYLDFFKYRDSRY